LVKFYNEINNHLKSKDEEVLHGNIYSIKILLTHSREDIFSSKLEEIADYVFSKRDHKSNII